MHLLGGQGPGRVAAQERVCAVSKGPDIPSERCDACMIMQAVEIPVGMRCPRDSDPRHHAWAPIPPAHCARHGRQAPGVAASVPGSNGPQPQQRGAPERGVPVQKPERAAVQIQPTPGMGINHTVARGISAFPNPIPMVDAWNTCFTHPPLVVCRWGAPYSFCPSHALHWRCGRRRVACQAMVATGSWGTTGASRTRS